MKLRNCMACSTHGQVGKVVSKVTLYQGGKVGSEYICDSCFERIQNRRMTIMLHRIYVHPAEPDDECEVDQPTVG